MSLRPLCGEVDAWRFRAVHGPTERVAVDLTLFGTPAAMVACGGLDGVACSQIPEASRYAPTRLPIPIRDADRIGAYVTRDHYIRVDVDGLGSRGSVWCIPPRRVPQPECTP